MGHLEVRVGGSRAGVRSRTSTMSEHLVRAYADGRLGLEPSRSSTICTREAGTREVHGVRRQLKRRGAGGAVVRSAIVGVPL